MKSIAVSFLLTAALSLASATLAAAPAPTNIRAFVPEGFEVTQRLDADLDGDKRADAALLLSRIDDMEDDRRVLVLLARDGAFVLGGRAELAFNPEPPHLEARRGVLVVAHENGGASDSMLVTWRYRYEAASKRMRLIGVDVSRYSRTNSMDAIDYSFNALTGDRTIKRSEVIDENPDGSEIPHDQRIYRDLPVEKRKLRAPNWYMENTPDPFELLSAK